MARILLLNRVMQTKILLGLALGFGFAAGLGACDDEREGAFCGGLAAEPCLETEYCDFVTTRCGADDAGGTCRPRPGACLDNVDPVIGSDGDIYNNACYAHVAGADDCGPAPDPSVDPDAPK